MRLAAGYENWKPSCRAGPAGPAFHPIWKGIDSDTITFADAHTGHGDFRNWAKLTAYTVRALGRLDREKVDQEVVHPSNVDTSQPEWQILPAARTS
ncbi:hypothetical protein [Nocardia vaccinii]|uniref:hypothetical protein n=1 Tax=Nocardia vaccinii TaxID=1822 RepID=UPI0008305DED|nr:hypothetical protein [Nocardia vaccinii]